MDERSVTFEDVARVIDTLGLNQLSEYIREWRVSKGFHTPLRIEGSDGDMLLGKLMLVVTEISEAAEAVRHNDWDNYVEELADTFIRLLDIVGTQGIDIEDEIMKKMKINEDRPHLHGKQTSL